MQLLRYAKKNQVVSPNLISALYWLLEIQLLGLFIVKKQSSLYGNLFKILDENINLSMMVIIIFSSYVIQILSLVVAGIWLQKSKKQKNKKQPELVILRILEFKPYIVFVIFSEINFQGLKTGSKLIEYLAIVNLVLMIVEMLIFRMINVSYRFVEKNFIRRKNSSIVPHLIIMAISFVLNFYDSSLLYAAALLILRAVLVLHKNYQNLQNQYIRNLQLVFPLISFQISFLILMEQYFSFNIFHNFTMFSFIFLFTIYASYDLSSSISLKIIKYHLSRSQIGRTKSFQRPKSINAALRQKTNIKQSQLIKLELQLYIFVKIYLLKLDYQNQTDQKLKSSQQISSENYNQWWSTVNKVLVDHKTNCLDVQCKCSLVDKKGSSQFSIENQILLDKIHSLIQTIKIQSINSNKSKIMENYFFVQLENKPLKSYFQIVKFAKTQLLIEEALQVDNLLNIARYTLTQLFLKQKVKNMDINVEPLFQFQNHLNLMRIRIGDMSVQYQRFYEVFADNFVQMQELKRKTKILTNYKEQFGTQIDSFLGKYNKSQQLMAFSIIYFTFFDEYTNKLEKVQERALFLQQTFKKPFVQSKKKKVDIFDPHYGAIKADLVFQLGKIVSITKNMCRLLGYPYRQLVTERVNRIMPAIFSRSHNRFLRNFIDKGQIKLLKLKEVQVYAKNSRKLIVPINLQLKVDYSSEEGMYGIVFTKLTETKSEYILMNNYGKIQEISAGIYDKFFSKAFGEEVTKIKRLCVGKFILSFNSVLRNIEQTHGLLQQGLILSSDLQETIMNYFKFPEFAKSYKGKSESGGQSTSRSFQSNSSFQRSYNSSDGSRTVDLSDDLAQHSLDLKEAFKIYLKNFDFRKITAYRVYYRCQNIVTSEFKCKIMQIVRIRQLFNGQILQELLKHEITELSQLMGYEQHQINDFKIFRDQPIKIVHSIKQFDQTKKNKEQNQAVEQQSKTKNNESVLNQQNIAEQISKYKKYDNQTDSVTSTKQAIKKKNQLINAFVQKPIINYYLEISLTLLFFVLAIILIVVCVFSVQLQGNQQKIIEDNLLITNYRIDFHILLGIQQMKIMYKAYEIQPPQALQDKYLLVLQRMKSQLSKMITWIDISRDGYQSLIPLKYENQNYEQKRTIMASMIQFYTTFLYAQQKGHHITNNYKVIYQNLLDLTTYEQTLIKDYNNQYVNKVHIVIGAYSLVLLLIIAVKIRYSKISFQKQNRIIDFLAFFKPKQAKKHAEFYEKFQEINKKSEQFDNKMIEQIDNQIQFQKLKKSRKLNQAQKSSGVLIKLVKNQRSKITFQIVLCCFLVLLLCLFVIFYTEFFFAEANTKFQAYLELKNSAFLVQLIPYRSIVLYFSDINRILQNKPIYDYPQNYYSIVHDRMFQLHRDLSDPLYFGSEMQNVISQHFSKEICTLVDCPKNSTSKDLLKDQQVYYLVNHFINAFSYMRKIIKMLPNMNNSKQEIKRWIDENNFLEVLETSDIILDLMKRSESTVTGLFSSQVNEIGSVLLALSLTLIPSLILTLLFFKKKFIEFLVEKLETTEQIFRNLSWQMIAENNYALNYFDDKIKNLKKK